MPFDENAPLLDGLVRPGAPRRPAKSSKQRGSILSNVHANRVTVFEEYETKRTNETDTHVEMEKVKDDRIRSLETVVKGLQQKNERIVIEQKTLSDRVSTTEANFVELKCGLMLSTKPSPSTPAKSRGMYDSSTDSPIICPSLTGAEENTSFASPPVPALQRKLLAMSLQGNGPSKLRSELQFHESEDEDTILDDDSMEVLAEDQFGKGYRESSLSWEDLGPESLESTIFKRKPRNPAPTLDPDVSLGDVSVIEGIFDDAARAGAYLDSQLTGHTNTTPRLTAESDGGNHDIEILDAFPASRQDESAAVHHEVSLPDTIALKTIMIDANIQTDFEHKITGEATMSANVMVDAIIQTEVELSSTFDAGIQVTNTGPVMQDAAIQTIEEDTTMWFEAIVQELSARVAKLEYAGEKRSENELLASSNHGALVDAYKELLRVEAEKRLDLVSMISNFKDEVASCKKERSHHPAIEGLGEWTGILSHLGVAVAVYVVVRAMSTS